MSPQSVSVLSQMNPIHAHPFCLFKIRCNIIPNLHPNLPSGRFPSGFSHKILYAFLFSPMRALGPTHLTILQLIIYLKDEYGSRSFLLCICLLFLPLFFSWLDNLRGPRPHHFEASRSYSDTPHSVGFLWTSDQPLAETST
jgi:hypothetical protein